MSMSLCLRPALRQRLSLECRLEQRLELKILPPEGMSYDEPDAMKKIEERDGKPVIRISRSEFASFVGAVRRVNELMAEACPDVVLISMRGALPMFRSAMQAADPRYLERELSDQLWEQRRVKRTVIAEKPSGWILDSVARDQASRDDIIRRYSSKKTISFIAAKMKTSYFLEDLSGKLQGGLSSAFGHRGGRKGSLNVVFLDTSVTGTKLGWFLPQFMGSLREVADVIGKDIHVLSLVLSHAKGGESCAYSGRHEGGKLYSSRVDIGVESLLAEDSPTLLGAGYFEDEVCGKARGVVRACEMPVPASLLIGDRYYDIGREPSGSSAALFARVMGNAARGS